MAYHVRSDLLMQLRNPNKEYIPQEQSQLVSVQMCTKDHKHDKEPYKPPASLELVDLLDLLGLVDLADLLDLLITRSSWK